jgi:hypothetical protein
MRGRALLSHPSTSHERVPLGPIAPAGAPLLAVAARCCPRPSPLGVPDSRHCTRPQFSPGKQMPANQAVTELIGGVTNAFDLLRNLPNSNK